MELNELYLDSNGTLLRIKGKIKIALVKETSGKVSSCSGEVTSDQQREQDGSRILGSVDLVNGKGEQANWSPLAALVITKSIHEMQDPR